MNSFQSPPHRLAASGDLRHFRTGIVWVCAWAAMLMALPSRAAAGSCGPRETKLDNGWMFYRGDMPGAEQPHFSEIAAWQAVTLPHDWAIAGPFLPANPSGGAGAFAPMGVGWYRRHLATAASGCDRRTIVQFDGVMANSDVWINGHLLGHRPNGYVSFRYDLTPFLNQGVGADNVLAVRADNAQQPSSRFYQGAGIYRHVHLLQVPQVHVADWSTVVTTPYITANTATVRVATELRNDRMQDVSAAVRITLIDAGGRQVATATTAPSALQSGATTPFSLTLTLPNPRLWTLEDPALYRARVQVLDGRSQGDQEEVAFGVREAHFDPETGFWLNGRNLKIKGVALHSDVGALGMAAPLSLWEQRLRAMQHMGANAVRTAHNPVAPEFLDLCDRLGILVLDEFFDVWTVGKNPYDYHLYFRDWYLKDTHDTVLRDRNHPSIIAWSAGNEIHDTPHPEIAKPILAALVAQYHADDPTRPVTQALFRPNAAHDYDDGLADLLDVVGQNYRPNELLAAHDAKPSRRILGTEDTHDRAMWLAVRDHPAFSGMFLWAGTDYLGESRHWPLFAESEGMNDRTDFPKPDSLEREAWWSERPVVHIVRRVAPVPKAPTDPGYELEQYRPRQTAFPDWSPGNREPHTEHVEVYSNCGEVQLQLNGADLGTKPLPADAAARQWDVAYIPGTLSARCVDKTGVSETLRSAGPAAALRLTQEAGCLGTGFDDVAAVRLTVMDADGVPVPGAQVPVVFSAEGSAVLLATDNADYAFSSVFSDPERTTYDGRAIAYVRGGRVGMARLHAVSPGLRAAALDLPVNAPGQGNCSQY